MASTGFTTSILEFFQGCPCASLLVLIFVARTFVALQVVATLNQADPRTHDQKRMDSPKDGENYFNRRQVVRRGYEHCNGCGVIGDSWALDTSSSTRLSAAFLQSSKGGKCQGTVVEHRHRIENGRNAWRRPCPVAAWSLQVAAPPAATAESMPSDTSTTSSVELQL